MTGSSRPGRLNPALLGLEWAGLRNRPLYQPVPVAADEDQPYTQCDVDRQEAAKLKRERKAAKRRRCRTNG